MTTLQGASNPEQYWHRESQYSSSSHPDPSLTAVAIWVLHAKPFRVLPAKRDRVGRVNAATRGPQIRLDVERHRWSPGREDAELATVGVGEVGGCLIIEGC
jgi:hypothetical protein